MCYIFNALMNVFIIAFSIAKGIPTAFLPVFHYLLAEYSVELSKYLLDNGFEFFSKNDLRFVEETYKVILAHLADVWNALLIIATV